MKKSLLLAAAFVVAAFVGGCGGGPAGSCGSTSSGQCVDYGTGFTSADVMRSCGAGMYSATACTATGRVGRCVITATSGGATASSTINFYAPITADIGMMACTAAGTGGATVVYMAN